MVTSDQIRAARALLGWSAQRLAEESGLNISTVQRLERATEKVRGNVRTLKKVVTAFESSGIEFLNENGIEGVIIRKEL